jgi:acyl carrier protein
MEGIAEKVIQVVAKMAKRNVGELTLDTRLAEDLMLKSINRVELAAILEDLLDVPITNFDILKPRTIHDIVEMVNVKKNKQ